jgi:peptidoglycan hydrolase-like protein with peptidoglycan-binding domain
MLASQGMNVVVYPSTEQPLVDNLFSQDYGKKAQAGDIGDIQKSLIDLGYNPGEVNSQFSQQTESAIRAFQKDAGLPVDGKISQGLAERLYQEINSFDRFNRKENNDPSKEAVTKDAASQPQSNQSQGPKIDFGNAFDDF